MKYFFVIIGSLNKENCNFFWQLESDLIFYMVKGLYFDSSVT